MPEFVKISSSRQCWMFPPIIWIFSTPFFRALRGGLHFGNHSSVDHLVLDQRVDLLGMHGRNQGIARSSDRA